jgi:osmotically-inducible protein OsmY
MARAIREGRRDRVAMRLSLLGILAAALAVLPALGGCVDLALAGAGQAGVEAMRERGLSGAAHDTNLRVAINQRWLDSGIITDNLYLQIWEGRVLVSGAVSDAGVRADAIQAAWQVEGVREVINEVEVVNRYGLNGYARDTRTTEDINARLLLARDIASINYTVEVVRGRAFLLGVARDAGEHERVLSVVRAVPRVTSIADYVLLRDDPRRYNVPPA